MVGLRAWLIERLESGSRTISIQKVLAELDAREERERVVLKSVGSRNGKVSISPDDLVGAWEVAQLLRVDRTRPSKWRLNNTTFGPDKLPFPEPFADLKTGPVWLRSQITPLIPFVEERRRHRD